MSDTRRCGHTGDGKLIQDPQVSGTQTLTVREITGAKAEYSEGELRSLCVEQLQGAR